MRWMWLTQQAENLGRGAVHNWPQGMQTLNWWIIFTSSSCYQSDRMLELRNTACDGGVTGVVRLERVRRSSQGIEPPMMVRIEKVEGE